MDTPSPSGREQGADVSGEVAERRADSPMLIEERGDVLVIRPLGRLDAEGIARTREAVAAHASSAVIVDLDECVLVDPEPLRFPVDVVPPNAEVCIVSGRLSCRRLLTVVGVAARIAVFQRQEDAIQARVMASEGYGRGWATS